MMEAKLGKSNGANGRLAEAEELLVNNQLCEQDVRSRCILGTKQQHIFEGHRIEKMLQTECKTSQGIHQSAHSG
jgi:hypothetical protein